MGNFRDRLDAALIELAETAELVGILTLVILLAICYAVGLFNEWGW